MTLVFVVSLGVICIALSLGGCIMYFIRRRDIRRLRNENAHLNAPAVNMQNPVELLPTAYSVAVALPITDANEKHKIPESSAEPVAMATAVQL